MSDKVFGEKLVAEMPRLRAFAISLAGSVALADDLVQETLVRAWAHADSFRPGTNFRAWLITILRNKYLNDYAKRRRETQDIDGELAAQQSVQPDQELKLEVQDMQKALLRLHHEHRELLLLVGLADISYEEAAEICGVPMGTIKSRLSRARARLAEELGLTRADRLDPPGNAK
jgi:RNA polymerase sigma-70 factor (ECF subfamily)